MRSTSSTGQMVELRVASEFAKHGITVYNPVSEHDSHDLLVEVAGDYYKIQCKHGRYDEDEDVVFVSLRSTRRNGTDKHYTADEVDYYASYASEIDRVFLIPFEEVGTDKVRLRVSYKDVRPCNKDKINWADQYSFDTRVFEL